MIIFYENIRNQMMIIHERIPSQDTVQNFISLEVQAEINNLILHHKPNERQNILMYLEMSSLVYIEMIT